jgi:hypothetical protein
MIRAIRIISGRRIDFFMGVTLVLLTRLQSARKFPSTSITSTSPDVSQRQEGLFVTVSFGEKTKKAFKRKRPKTLYFLGGPCWNRTNNLLIKSQVLCLVELTALRVKAINPEKGFIPTIKSTVNFFIMGRDFFPCSE